MPVTTDTLWNMKRLNRWFGVSALLAMVSFVWMMWHDYNRPWKALQTQYFNDRSAMAHFTALSFETEESKKKYDDLKGALAAAEAELQSGELKKDVDKWETAKTKIGGELQGVSLTYGNRNAELGVTSFLYEEMKMLHGADHPETIRMRDRLRSEMAVIEKLKESKDDLEDDLREAETKLKEMYAKRAAAKRAVEAYEKEMEDARRRDAMYGPGVSRSLLNLPILDAFPTKDTPGREEVKQVFMPDIRVNYNFTDSYATDRCATCHYGIDDPEFSKENFLKQAEAALRSPIAAPIIAEENEKLVVEMRSRLNGVEPKSSDGQNKAAFINARVNAANIYLEEIKRPMIATEPIQKAFAEKEPDHGLVQSEIETAFRRILAAAPPKANVGGENRPIPFEQMSPDQQSAYFKSVIAAANLYLANAPDGKRPPIDFKPVLAAHPRLDLFVSPNSPHPMKKMGCTVCHEGSGQDTDFVLAAHTPKSDEEKEEWKKYYVKELGLPLTTFHTVEEFWERPMLISKYVSASCVKCHDQIYDLERSDTEPVEEASNIVRGRELFTRVGCINCHNVEGLGDSRRVGTDLTHVGDKLSTGFIERWVDYPNNFRPSTRMPHFFHQENNTESSANTDFDPKPVTRTETEIKAMAHYLKVFSKPFEAMPLPEGIEGDAARGEELLTSIGCLACHVDLEAKDPTDSDGRTLGERWIVTDIAMAQAQEQAEKLALDQKSATPEMKQGFIDAALPEAKAAFEKMSKNDRARYASRRFDRERRDRARLAAKTELFVADTESRTPDPLLTYVPPEFTRHGPELSGMGTKLVNDPNDPAQVAHGRTWLYNWLVNPRHYSSYTVMPRLFRQNYYQNLPPEEQKKRNDQDILDVVAYLLTLRNDDFPTEPIPATSEHTAEMERLILHILGGQNTEDVAKRILRDEKADPSEDYGPLTRAIVSQAYASFGGDDEAKKHVADLIAAKSGSLQERQQLYFGMKMISHYGCYSCHNIAGFEEATRPGTDLTTWAQKFMSQLDFAFFSPVFDEKREAEKDVWGHIYPGMTDENREEFKHLIRDVGETSHDLVSGSAGAMPTGGNIEAEVHHSHASFAYHKMRNPRIWDRAKDKKPYEKLKMPNFYFTEAEARAVTTYLLSRREPDVRPGVKIAYKGTPDGRVAKGRALVHELNCIGCHTIEADREATIHQYYSDDTSLSDDVKYGPRFKPPLLWGEGAKVQYDWLFGFLNNVEMLRPWLIARMPSFHLSTDDATILVEYFAGLSEIESELLKDKIAPIVKHLQDVHSSGDAEASVPWFHEDKFEETADFLKSYALRHNQAKIYDFDPTDPGSLKDAFNRLLGRFQFLSNVFDIEYPYNDLESHTVSDARFKLGEEFFFDQKCLACHVGGDPSLPGTTIDIKAPNFALSYKRLRYDWIIKWMQDPQAIQPGTNMPQVFPGKSAFASRPDREELEAKFGSSPDEQARLMADFLFALGERRHTSIQPGAAEKAAQPAAETETEFDFDSGGGEEKKQDEEVEFDFDS